jgi:hypothetical protein
MNRTLDIWNSVWYNEVLKDAAVCAVESDILLGTSPQSLAHTRGCGCSVLRGEDKWKAMVID